MSEFQEVFRVDIPIAGALAVGAGVLRYVVPVNAQLIDARASINTAPTGANAILTVKQNGAALTSTGAGVLTVAAGANVSNVLSVTPGIANGTNYIGVTVPTSVPVATVVPGDYFTVDVTQIGSTVAGSNAVVTLTFIHR